MNAWLATVVGETAAPIVGFVLLFLLVIALLLAVFAILRRATGGTFVAGGRSRQVRLSVTDAAAVDNRRRLVLVRRDDVEHLILIGGPSDVVIEQNIRQFARQPVRVEAAAPVVAQADQKPPMAVAEPAPTQPAAAPAAPVERAAPPVAPAPRPAPPLQAAPLQAAPQAAQREATPPPPPPRPIAPAKDLRLAEPPKHGTAAVPVPPTSPPVEAAVPESVAPAVHAPAASGQPPENGNGWQRTASPSFGTPSQPRPAAETADPSGAAPAETRTTTAAAFPFSVRNDPAPSAPTSSAYKEPTLENLGPAETEEPDIALGDLDFTDAFETDLEGELHIAPGKDAKPKKADSIEDEMERLLGDLSSPDKR